jgi:hypothetical protein
MSLPPFSPSGVPQSASEILARRYREAAERLKKIVMNPPGSKASSQASRRARAAGQLQQIDQVVIPNLLQDASGWIGEHVPPAYTEGKKEGDANARKWVKVPAAKELKTSFSLIDHHALNALANKTFSDLQKSARSMGEVAKSLIRDTADMGLSSSDLHDIIAGGIIDGQPRDAIRDLSGRLKKINNGQVARIVNRNGAEMNFDADYYAELVVRTMTRQAVQEGRHNRFRETRHRSGHGRRPREREPLHRLPRPDLLHRQRQDPAGYPSPPLRRPPVPPQLLQEHGARSSWNWPTPSSSPPAPTTTSPRSPPPPTFPGEQDVQGPPAPPAVTQRYGKISPIQGAKRQTAEESG